MTDLNEMAYVFQSASPIVPLRMTITRLRNILLYFTPVKMINFQMNNCDIYIIFAQNIDYVHTLKPPR